jgi:hypothetical protein
MKHLPKETDQIPVRPSCADGFGALHFRNRWVEVDISHQTSLLSPDCKRMNTPLATVEVSTTDCWTIRSRTNRPKQLTKFQENKEWVLVPLRHWEVVYKLRHQLIYRIYLRETSVHLTIHNFSIRLSIWHFSIAIILSCASKPGYTINVSAPLCYFVQISTRLWCRIRGSHSGGCDEYNLLGYNAV